MSKLFKEWIKDNAPVITTLDDTDYLIVLSGNTIKKISVANAKLIFGANGGNNGTGTPSTTIFLSHFNGAEGSTNFVDVKAHSVVFVGSPTLSTTVKKFGESSLYLPNFNSYAKAENHIDFKLETELTIECFIYLDSQFQNNNYYAYMLGIEAANFGISIGKNRSGISNKWFVTIGNLDSASSIETLADVSFNTLNYIAVTRKNGTNKFFLNGQLQGSNTNALSFPSNPYIAIGNSPYNYSTYFPYQVRGMIGYIDEMRLSNVAKEITSIPTGAFSDS